MPLIHNEYQNTYRLALWSLTEPLSFFEEKAQLSPNDRKIYQNISNEHRKCEWLAARLLLKEVLGFWPNITYTETGKPILQNHTRYLSISHSKTMVGILLCTNPFAGIDIERSKRNIEKVAKRFLSEKEQADVLSSPLADSRLLYWCAKEAIFKAVNESNVSFSKQINIEALNDDGSMTGHYRSEKEKVDFELRYIQLDNHWVVWTS